MKRIVLLISVAAMALLCGSKASAQGKYGPDSTECIKYLSYYTEYFKQKNYDAALPNWRKAYKYCPPTARYTMLSDGTTLMRRLIQQNAKNSVYKEKLIDSLMVLYSQRVEFWPKYSVNTLNNQASDIYNYYKNEPVKLYEGLSEIISKLGSKTRANNFLFHVNTAIDLYKEGLLDAEKVIEAYENAIKYLGEVTPKNETEGKMIAKTVEDIESLFIQSHVASCDNLIALFTPRFEADPQNVDIAKNIVRMMNVTEDCTDNDLFMNAVTVMYNSEPSHTSAYFLYKLHSSRDESDLAVKYIKEAIDREDSDPATDAGYLYELAAYSYKNSNITEAYNSARKAAELDSSVAGKAYMLMGTIWGTLPCSGDEIQQRSKYWVAVDYMIKARNADETLAETANDYIRQYSAYYPQTAEAFMFNLTDGQSYDVSCGGLRATTTVRTQK